MRRRLDVTMVQMTFIPVMGHVGTVRVQTGKIKEPCRGWTCCGIAVGHMAQRVRYPSYT